jgi:hypothetical protein
MTSELTKGDRFLLGAIATGAIAVGVATLYHFVSNCTLEAFLRDDVRIVYTAFGSSLCFFGLFFLLITLHAQWTLVLSLLRTGFFLCFGSAFLLIPILRPDGIVSRVGVSLNEAPAIHHVQNGSWMGVIAYLAIGVMMVIIGILLFVKDLRRQTCNRQTEIH